METRRLASGWSRFAARSATPVGMPRRDQSFRNFNLEGTATAGDGIGGSVISASSALRNQASLPASQRSASMAAWQPMPAAVMAWR